MSKKVLSLTAKGLALASGFGETGLANWIAGQWAANADFDAGK